MSASFILQYFRVHLEPKVPLHMPAYNKGNVIRGGFGSTFRLSGVSAQAGRIVCHWDRREVIATGNSRAGDFASWKRGAMNSETNVITYAFRKPRFPLICDFDGDLFAAQSTAALQRRLGGLDLVNERKARFVDANGESWIFLLNEMILAPEFPMRRWRKIEIIHLFNGSRTANEMGLCYPERRLANRRLDMIVRDIAALLKRKSGA
jgi:hypothetical protein